jgi:hypothetical protein
MKEKREKKKKTKTKSLINPNDTTFLEILYIKKNHKLNQKTIKGNKGEKNKNIKCPLH